MSVTGEIFPNSWGTFGNRKRMRTLQAKIALTLSSADKLAQINLDCSDEIRKVSRWRTATIASTDQASLLLDPKPHFPTPKITAWSSMQL
jgi:hypothetical protein